MVINIDALDKVRETLESNIGERVKLKANRGRRRTYVNEGIINDIYPSVFTVLVDIDGQSTRTLCYTYSDVLTSNVELVVCKNNQRI
ncbi:MAG TPA: Veg family protein [Clostridia bacterium]|nr:Veg family protein [Clostridia bacterium]